MSRLSREEKLIISFIEECRDQQMMKDELYNTKEELYKNLFALEDLLKGNETGTQIYIKLESLLYDTLQLTKETYFEYGQNYAGVQSDALWQRNTFKENKEAA